MQRGGSIPVFSGTSYQRGHGLGRVVRAVWREATPILKEAGKKALKSGFSEMTKGILGKRALKSGFSAVTAGIFGGKRKRKVYDIEKDEKNSTRARTSSNGARARPAAVRGRGASRSLRGGARGQKGSGRVRAYKRKKDVLDANFEQENDN